MASLVGLGDGQLSRSRPSQKVQTQKVIALLSLSHDCRLLLNHPWANDYFLVFHLFGLADIDILLDKIAHLGLGIVVVARVHKSRLDFCLTSGWRLCESNEVKQRFQDLAIVVDVVLRLWELG